MQKVYIASSRKEEIGTRCQEWAAKNLPQGFEMTSSPEECQVFISVLYDTLLPQKFIDKRRCFNFHPGILPDYRGSGVYSWVLINQESETGVTLHEIDYTIDTGPIIDTTRTPITEYDTAESLFDRCMELLYILFTCYFVRILTEEYDVRPNNGGYLYLRKDLEEAKDISRFIRAFTFQGKERCYWKDHHNARHYLP